MSIDLKFVELTVDVLEIFFILKQLAKMSIDLKFVKLTADVLEN